MKKIYNFLTQWLIIILVFFLIFCFSFKTICDIDIGYHLRGGKWILENKSFHRYDVFTYTVNNNEYIALHWPFQIILYLIYKLFGYDGLTYYTVFVFTLLFLLIFIILKRNGVSNNIFSCIVYISLFAFELRFRPKPESFTYLFIVITILILDEYYKNKKNFLFFLPLIKIIWTNSHGLFIIGDFITFSYFISILIHQKKFDKKFFIWSLISLFSSFLTPYHYKGFLFPFYLYTRMQSSNVFKRLIDEFQSPFSVAPSTINPFVPKLALNIFFGFCILGVLLLIINYRRFKIHHFLIFSGFLFISLKATRNIPLYLIYSIYIISLGIKYIKIPQIRIKNSFSATFPLILSFIVFLTSLRLITNAYYVGMRDYGRFGKGLEEFVHPIGAANFLSENKLDGRILNDMNSGSWFIWKAPQKVFIDGRLEVMKEDFFSEYLLTTKEGGLKYLIDKYKPVLVSFDYIITLQWFYQISKLKDWHLIYFDENSAIYRSASYAENFMRPDFKEEMKKRKIFFKTEEEVEKILKMKRRNKFIRFLEGFYRKKIYPYSLIKMGIFAFLNGEYKVAEAFYLEFLKQTNGDLFEIYYNLGSLYYRIGRLNNALYCYEIVLKEQKNNKVAKKRIDEIYRILKYLKNE